jgi:hypothetical protein
MTNAGILAFASCAQPGNSTGIIREKLDDVASSKRRTLLNELQSDPDVDNDRNELERINMQPGGSKVDGFASTVKVLHRKTVEGKSILHDAPHDAEFGGPTSEAAIGSVRQESVGRGSGY